MSEPKRLFFALELPAEVQRQIVHWRAASFPEDAGRPVTAANLHLTLAFLGEVSADKQRALSAMAERIRQPGFTLTLDDAGQWLRSRVVWLGTRQPPRGVLQLANMLRARPPAAAAIRVRSRFIRISPCCATRATRWLFRRPDFAGRLRSTNLYSTNPALAAAAPATRRWNVTLSTRKADAVYSPATVRHPH